MRGAGGADFLEPIVWLGALAAGGTLVLGSVTALQLLLGARDVADTEARRALPLGLLFTTLALALVARWLLARAGRAFERPADLATRKLSGALSYALLAAPVLLGGARTVGAIAEILR